MKRKPVTKALSNRSRALSARPKGLSASQEQEGRARRMARRWIHRGPLKADTNIDYELAVDTLTKLLLRAFKIGDAR